MVNGLVAEGVDIKFAEEALNEELCLICDELVAENELQKVKNKVESAIIMSQADVRTKALNLAIFELLGDADLINNDILRYRDVKPEDIKRVAKELFRKTNCSTLYYLSGDKKL